MAGSKARGSCAGVGAKFGSDFLKERDSQVMIAKYRGGWGGGCRKGFLSVGVLLLLLICAERPAQAYADPGSGAMLVQILAAAFVGASFYMRKLVRWFRPKGKD